MSDPRDPNLFAGYDDYKVTVENPRKWQKKDGKFEDLSLAELPRYEPFIEVVAQVARSVAMCMICGGAIAKGSVRLSFKVNLPLDRQDKYGNARQSERYNIHAGCIVQTFEGLQLRDRNTCFDCGASSNYRQGHPWRCFTGSKFAPAPLCPDCSQRKRWTSCEECVLFYPTYMVSPVATEGEFENQELCVNCATSNGVKTVVQVEQERAEFEEVRRKLAEGLKK